MEFNERKLKILRTIIEDYISTAMPVGSRTIARHFGMQLSSATIRNEMSDLEEMGYLEQPHASAGRIPSDKAYRFYVDNLMNMTMLSPEEISYIRSYYHERMGETEKVLSAAAKVISELTNYVSVVMSPKLCDVKVNCIQLVPINDRTALVVLVTDSGIIKDTPIQLPNVMTQDQLYDISKLMNKMFAGRRVDELNLCAQAQINGEMREQVELFHLVTNLIESQVANDQDDFLIGGASNFLSYHGATDIDQARGFLQMLEAKDVLSELFQGGTDMEIRVKIGSESGIGKLHDYSVVTATYTLGGKTVGKIGVIGPTRMKYSKVISVLDYMGKSLSEILSEMNGIDPNKHKGGK